MAQDLHEEFDEQLHYAPLLGLPYQVPLTDQLTVLFEF